MQLLLLILMLPVFVRLMLATAWWPDAKRAVTLTAAETHRWETGHPRVVARGFGGGHVGQLVMEVGDE